MIASVDTYLRFAEATNRLDLYEKGGKDLTEVIGDMQEGGASKKTSGAIKGVKKALKRRRATTTTSAGRRRSRPRAGVRPRMRDDCREPERSTTSTARPGTTSTAWCPVDGRARPPA